MGVSLIKNNVFLLIHGGLSYSRVSPIFKLKNQGTCMETLRKNIEDFNFSLPDSGGMIVYYFINLTLIVSNGYEFSS